MRHIKWLKQFKRFIKIKANARSWYFNIIFFPVKKKTKQIWTAVTRRPETLISKIVFHVKMKKEAAQSLQGLVCHGKSKKKQNSNTKNTTTEQVECERHRFPKPQRTWCKWRMIKKENIWWAERGARTRQSHVSGKHVPTTHIPKHTHIHALTLVYAHGSKTACCPTWKQGRKKKSPLHTHTHTLTIHMHTCTLHPLCQRSHTAGRTWGERKEEKAKVGCDWRVHCMRQD